MCRQDLAYRFESGANCGCPPLFSLFRTCRRIGSNTPSLGCFGWLCLSTDACAQALCRLQIHECSESPTTGTGLDSKSKSGTKRSFANAARNDRICSTPPLLKWKRWLRRRLQLSRLLAWRFQAMWRTLRTLVEAVAIPYWPTFGHLLEPCCGVFRITI